MRSLRSFLESEERNRWILMGDMRVYARKGTHLIEGRLERCLDVASIEVEEEARGRGLFTEWLAGAERAAKKRGLVVYVENVLNPDLGLFLTRRGYSKVGESSPDSFFKRP